MSFAVNIEGAALHGHMKSVSMLKFNREGDLLFSSSRDTNCTLSCWSVKGQPRDTKLLGTYTAVGQEGIRKSADSALVGLDVNMYSTMVAGCTGGEEVLIWSVDGGQLLGVINRPMSRGSSVGFSHDDRLMMVASKGVGAAKSAINLYNMPFRVPAMGEPIEPAKTAFNPFTTLELDTSEEKISWACWGPTNDTIYFAEGGYMHIMDVETSRVIRSRQVHEGEGKINRFKFDKDYLSLATASDDCTAHLIDFKDLSTIQVYKSNTPINDISISPKGDHVILGGGLEASAVTTQGGSSVFEVMFYHKVHGTQLGRLRCHFGTINAMEFRPDGRGFSSGGHDGIVKLYQFDDSYLRAPGTEPIWTFE